MVDENAWGAPRVHSELQKLGFDIAERTVSRYMPRGRDPAKRGRRMANVPSQPPRCDRRDGLLHRPDGPLPEAVCLVRDRARPQEHRSLQRDREPDLGLGDPAAPRGVPVRVRAALLDPRSRRDLLEARDRHAPTPTATNPVVPSVNEITWIRTSIGPSSPSKIVPSAWTLSTAMSARKARHAVAHGPCALPARSPTARERSIGRVVDVKTPLPASMGTAHHQWDRGLGSRRTSGAGRDDRNVAPVARDLYSAPVVALLCHGAVHEPATLVRNRVAVVAAPPLWASRSPERW